MRLRAYYESCCVVHRHCIALSAGQATQQKPQAHAASPSPKADALHKMVNAEDAEQALVVKRLMGLLGVSKSDQVNEHIRLWQ